MKKEIKKYVLTCEQLDDHKKGETVIFIDGFWFWEAENMCMLEICDFDPSKSKFFTIFN